MGYSLVNSINNAKAIRQLKERIGDNAEVDFDGNKHDSLAERLLADMSDLYNRANDASLMPYEGQAITATESYKGMTKDSVVKGRTYQNVCDGVVAIDYTASSNYDGWFPVSVTSHRLSLFKPNTNYTVICTAELNGTGEYRLNAQTHDECLFRGADSVMSISSSGVYRFLVTTVSDFTGVRFILRRQNITARGDVKIYDFIFLEGDYTNVPLSELPLQLDGIESVEGAVEVKSTNGLLVGDVEASNPDFKSNSVVYKLDEPLRSLPNKICDTIENGQLIRKVGERAYEKDDESLDNVITDLNTTLYELAEPIVTPIDTSELITYDTTTHITATASGNVQPIISTKVPSNIPALVAATMAKNQELKVELAQTNITLESGLIAVDELRQEGDNDLADAIMEMGDIMYQRL